VSIPGGFVFRAGLSGLKNAGFYDKQPPIFAILGNNPVSFLQGYQPAPGEGLQKCKAAGG
jgi:hypothetical protein